MAKKTPDRLTKTDFEEISIKRKKKVKINTRHACKYNVTHIDLQDALLKTMNGSFSTHTERDTQLACDLHMFIMIMFVQFQYVH